MGENNHLFKTILVWQAKAYTNKSLWHLNLNDIVTFVALKKSRRRHILTDQEADYVTNLYDISRDIFC